VFVIYTNGQQDRITTDPSQPLSSIKDKVNELRKIPVDKQRIFFRGVELTNNAANLGKYNVKDKSRLRLVERSDFVIFVEKPTGNLIRLEVHPLSTIHDVKVLIQRTEGLPVSRQILLFNNVLLDKNNKRLPDYKIINQSKLKLGSMQIIVRLLTGKRVTFDVKHSDEIISIKRRLFEQEKIPLAEQRLLFGRRELSADDNTLSDYNIRHLSVLHLTRFEIFVKTLTNKRLRYEVEPSTPVENIKSRVEQSENIPVNDQRILFHNHLLQQGKPLSFYHVKHRSTLVLAPVIKEPFNIFVRLPNGKRIELTVQPNEPIKNIKEQVNLREGFPVNKQRLLFERRTLATDRRISDYSVVKGSTLVLVLTTKPPIEVIIKEPTGETFKLPIVPDEPIRRINQQIENKRQIPQNQQTLVFKGGILDSRKTPDNYKIPDQGVIELRIRAPFQVNVRFPNGELVTYQVSPNEPVNNIKQTIKETKRIPVAQQRLLFNNQPLNSRKTLNNYHVPNNAVLVLIVSQPFSVIIKLPNGQRFTLTVNPQQPVRNIKEKINEIREIPVPQQVLKFRNKELDSTKALTDYNVPNRGVLVLVVSKEPYVVNIKITRQVGDTVRVEKLQLQVDPRQPIETIKERIRELRNIPVAQQQLLHKEKTLHPRHSLTHYKVPNKSELVLKINEPFNLFIHLPSGEVLNLLTSPERTINNIKHRIENLRNIPVFRQQLWFTNDKPEKTLDENTKSLKAYDVPNNSHLKLVLKKVDEITVRVLTPTEEELIYRVNPNKPIRDLKNRISKDKNIPVKDQILSFRNEPLNPRKSLIASRVPNNALLVLTVRKQPFIVFVKLPRNEPLGTVEFAVNPNHPIKEILERLRDLNVQTRLRRLIHGNEKLNPKRSLKYYRIPNKSVLELLIVLPHVPPRPQTTVRPRHFLVNVHHPNGDQIRLFLLRNQPVRNIKERVQSIWHIAVKRQTLTFNKRHLSIKKRISDYHIPYGGDIYLHVKPDPRPRPRPIIPGKQFVIFVQQPNGKRTELHVQPKDIIRSIKHKIFDHLRVPVNQQQLFFKKKPLGINNRLSDYRVPNKGVVNLVVRPHDEFVVFVRHQNHAELRLVVERTHPIEKIKQQVEQRFHVPIKNQRLVYHKHRLSRTKRLSDYHVPNRAVIHLVLKDQPQQFIVFVRHPDGHRTR
jgi:ubiquitin C